MVITKRGLVLGTTAIVLTSVAVTGVSLALSNSPKELVDEVWHIIDRDYVDATFNQVDWQGVRETYVKNRFYTNKEDAYKAIREMLEKLEDPYTRFMDPEEFQNMQIDTSGELTGVGIQLAQDEETKKLIVISPIEDSPAFKAGILAKDIILKIDDQSTEGMDVNTAVDLIRGEPGTTVTLKIKRGNQELDYELKRARIEIHPVRYSYRESPTDSIGYIRLSQFSAKAAEEMRDAIQDLEKKKVTGYVLDLRSNPGGLLYASIEIARMWLPDGTIVSTVDRQGESDRQTAKINPMLPNTRLLTEKPLVVLVDGGSASASEILSGALQDNNRAKLVGTQTFGKGLVQSVRKLDGDDSGIAVTIAKYLTPSGRDINKAGIHPDIVFELTDAQRKQLQQNRDQVGTLDDPQYAKAVEILNQEIAAKRGNQAASSGR